MIALSVKGKNSKEILEIMSKNNLTSDLFEVRLDFLEDLTVDNIKKVLQEVNDKKTRPIIVTLRSRKEGGNFPNKTEDQLDVLLYAISLGVEYIDIELGWPGKTYKLIEKKKGNTKVIGSYHNLSKTLSVYGLHQIVRKLIWAKSDIVKIATFANDIKDNLNLFSTLEFINKRYKKPAICLAMGEKGMISRVLQTEMGGLLTFVSASDDEKTATGQLTSQALSNIKDLLKLNPNQQK